jgi:TonB family protein
MQIQLFTQGADGQEDAILSPPWCWRSVGCDISEMMRIREQRFLVTTEPFCAGFWSSFVALWTPRRRATANSAYSFRNEKNSAYLFRSGDPRRFLLPGKSLCGSVVLHVIAVFLLFRLAQTLPPTLHAAQLPIDKEAIYYFPKPQHHETLPRITPPGPGGNPGRGVQPQEKPKLGSSTFHRDLTVISNPVHPDNAHQTIIQPSSPPDLIIKQDLKLPNLVLGNPLAKAKAPLQIAANPVKPIAPQNTTKNVAAPQFATLDPGQLASLAPTVEQPLVKVKAPLQFASNPLKPIAPQNTTHNVAAPQLATIDPGQLASLAPTVQQPRLPVSPLAPPRAAAGTSAASMAGGGSAATSDGTLGDPNGLLILGTDPAAPGSSISLPPGNRYGAFSISSAGGDPGSPGGVAEGIAGRGTGGSGSGGDESTGLGGGRTGGGGGGSLSAAAPISVAGSGATAGTRASLEASIAAEAVFPVITAARSRRNSIVISAGSAGGGGLGVYQALKCGRIYTIFVPMSIGNWTLQYCQQNASQPSAPSSANSKVIQAQGELLPPDPLEKFDFRRMPVPAESAHSMLVIKGVVREDGTVDGLEVYQSVLRELDNRALAALKKWKFAPAQRDAKPVAVQILVGIQFPGPAAR